MFPIREVLDLCVAVNDGARLFAFWGAGGRGKGVSMRRLYADMIVLLLCTLFMR